MTWRGDIRSGCCQWRYWKTFGRRRKGKSKVFFKRPVQVASSNNKQTIEVGWRRGGVVREPLRPGRPMPSKGKV